MKEIIEFIIDHSGLSHEQFAKAVGISPANLSTQKRVRRIDIEKVINWATAFEVPLIECYNKKYSIKIEIR